MTALDPTFLDRIHAAGVAAERRFPVTSPIDGRALASVADCGEAEARSTLDLAAGGFERWKRTTAYERAAVMKRWHA
ncbi:MAG: aldehyde dehydrogenase family protein, partial [Gemmatimonadales bacterium]|nr:aldehyde dehydrogenase family protein [Gemmatimonadales bacterium]